MVSSRFTVAASHNGSISQSATRAVSGAGGRLGRAALRPKGRLRLHRPLGDSFAHDSPAPGCSCRKPIRLGRRGPDHRVGFLPGQSAWISHAVDGAGAEMAHRGRLQRASSPGAHLSAAFDGNLEAPESCPSIRSPIFLRENETGDLRADCACTTSGCRPRRGSRRHEHRTASE